MFSPDITLNDGAVDHLYSQTSLVGGTSVRVDPTTELNVPSVLTISHVKKGTGSQMADRHLVKLETSTVDSAGVIRKGSVYVVMDIPRSTFNADLVFGMVTQVKGFLTSTNVTKLLHNEP